MRGQRLKGLSCCEASRESEQVMGKTIHIRGISGCGRHSIRAFEGLELETDTRSKRFIGRKEDRRGLIEFDGVSPWLLVSVQYGFEELHGLQRRRKGANQQQEAGNRQEGYALLALPCCVAWQKRRGEGSDKNDTRWIHVSEETTAGLVAAWHWAISVDRLIMDQSEEEGVG